MYVCMCVYIYIYILYVYIYIYIYIFPDPALVASPAAPPRDPEDVQGVSERLKGSESISEPLPVHLRRRFLEPSPRKVANQETHLQGAPPLGSSLTPHRPQGDGKL